MKNSSPQKFRTGMLVQLKSGGPSLTVETVNKDKVTVHWFEGEKLREHSFIKDQLQLVPEKKISDLEVARRVAFILEKGAREVPGFDKLGDRSLDTFIGHISGKGDKR